MLTPESKQGDTMTGILFSTSCMCAYMCTVYTCMNNCKLFST